MDIATDGDRGLDFKQIWLSLEDVRGCVEDEERLVFGKTAFTIKVVLEERHIATETDRINTRRSSESKTSSINIRFGRIDLTEELLVGRLLEGGCLDILDDALLGAYDGAIVLGVDGEVDLGDGLLLGDGLDAGFVLLEFGSQGGGACARVRQGGGHVTGKC